MHTGEGRAFQTGVDVAGARQRRHRAWSATASRPANFDLHFTSWHQRVAKPVITAVNGLCAGGAFHWVADADIVIAASDAQFFDPHVSVGQVVAHRGDRAACARCRSRPSCGWRSIGRHERMSAERAVQLGMISQIVDPPEKLARRSAGARREDRAQLAGGDAGDQAGAVGCAGDRASPTPAARARRSWSRCGGIPTRRRGRWPSPTSARPNGCRSTPRRRPAPDRARADGQPARPARGAARRRRDDRRLRRRPRRSPGRRCGRRRRTWRPRSPRPACSPGSRWRSCSRTGPRSSPPCSASGTRVPCTCRSTRASRRPSSTHYLSATRPALLIARQAPADVAVPTVIAGELSWTAAAGARR